MAASTRRFPVPNRISALALAAALAVSACGSGSTDSASSTNLDDAATAEATESTTPSDEATTSTTAPTNRGEAMPISCSPLPDSTTTVSMLPPWGDGVTRSLELQIGREDSRQPTSAGLSLTPVQVRSTAIDDDVTELTWEAEASVLDGLGLSADDLDALGEIPPQRFEYRLGSDRLWLGADNTEEIRATALTTIDLLADSFDEQTLQQVRALYESMPDENLAQLFTEEPRLFHSLEGIALTIGTAAEAPELLPNALGGDPFPAITTVEIVDLVDGDGCVSIELRTVLDRDETDRILADTLEARFPDSSAADLESIMVGFEIENLVVAQYDAGSGFFRTVTGTQRTSDGSTERVDTKIITDVTSA